MRAKRKQLLLDDSFILSLVHGGEYSVEKRKIICPVSTKKPMHLTLRSSFAIGRYSFRVKKNRDFISKIIGVSGKKWGVKVYSFSINSNHLHFSLRSFTRVGFQNFLRAVSAQVAAFVTGAKRGRPFGKRFFDLPAFSRITEWGRAFSWLNAYVLKNQLEASGAISYQPRTPMRLTARPKYPLRT